MSKASSKSSASSSDKEVIINDDYKFPVLFRKVKLTAKQLANSDSSDLEKWDVMIIYTKNGHFFSEHGRWGSELQVDNKPAQSKNVGKKNETTQKQQAFLQAKTHWLNNIHQNAYMWNIGPSFTSHSGGVEIPQTIDSRLLNDKMYDLDCSVHRLPSCQLAVDKQKKKSEFGFPRYYQDKLDGGRLLASLALTNIDEKKIEKLATIEEYMQVFEEYIPHFNTILSSRTYSIKPNKPTFESESQMFIIELMKEAISLGWNTFITLDGECFVHEIRTFNQIMSYYNTNDPHPDEGIIEYHVYDLLEYNHGSLSHSHTHSYACTHTFAERFQLLERVYNRIANTIPHIKLCRTFLIHSELTEKALEANSVENNYEGGMIRNPESVYEPGVTGSRAAGLIKKKRFIDSEFTIVDIIRGQGRHYNRAVFCFKSEVNGQDWTSACIGSGDIAKDYLDRREELIGKLATVKYFGIDDGVPRFPTVKAVRE